MEPAPVICAAGLSGCNSVVECLLPKQDVVGSIPITRSNPEGTR